MADTKHHHAPSPPPVEGDGVSYSGIFWFVVVLTVTTVGCQLLVGALFAYLDHQSPVSASARSPLASPAGQLPPAPNLLRDEPGNLKGFLDSEHKALSTYDWVDKETGTIRLPIDRAKDLIIERGLPVRGATPPPAGEKGK
jgi:hypothetical protein